MYSCPRYSSSSRIDATFPHLRFVVISAVQPRFDAEAGPEAAASWTALLGLLRELERTCKRVEGMRMVVLERDAV